MASSTLLRRGNQLHILPALSTQTDPCWNAEDSARFATFRARWPTEKPELLMCQVWKQKVPGLTYTSNTESALSDLSRVSRR